VTLICFLNREDFVDISKFDEYGVVQCGARVDPLSHHCVYSVSAIGTKDYRCRKYINDE